MTTVLVTGTSGFVGSAIGMRLKQAGVEVHGLSRTPSRPESIDRHITHDLRTPLRVAERYDAVVHCAALSSPWASPRDFHASNVLATEHVLEWCRKNGLPPVVFISSSSVHYEDRDQFDVNEETPLPSRPINEYARTKRHAESLVRAYEGVATILRPRAVFGPGDTVLFPRILTAAKAGRLPILTRSDRAPVRGDLIYIDNLADYVRLALQRPTPGTYLVTNNSPVDIHAFLFSVFDRLDYPKPTRRVPIRAAMALARVSEIASAWFMNYREPAVTRYGVSVFAYSKTFDVSKAIRTFGPPAVSNDEGRDRFVRWWTSRDR